MSCGTTGLAVFVQSLLPKVFALVLAIPLGLNLGILLGNIVFKWVFRAARPKDYVALCDESRDATSQVTDPMSGPVSLLKRRLLNDTSPALREPDYDRVRFMNKLLSQLWPHLSPAVYKEVVAQSREPIRATIASIPVLGGRIIKDVRIDRMDLGTRPFRIDSFKSYKSSASENWIMLETPLLWGGDIRVRVVVELSCFGLFTVDVPIEVANVQLKALARITMYPLVEQLPCVGGVTISLLEQPTVDLDLHILDSPDLLSFPPLPVLLRLVKSIVISRLLIYPNEMSFPILPNYGLPLPPKGIFQISVCYGINLKSSLLDEIDPFVRIELRKGRVQSTDTVDDEPNPVWTDAHFDMVVDDFQTQKLTVELYDDNVLTSPGLVGAVRIDLGDMQAVGFCAPHETHRLLVPVFAPRNSSVENKKGAKVYEILGKEEIRKARHDAFVEDTVKAEVKKKPQAKLLIPYLMRKRAAKMARKQAMKEVEARMRKEEEEEEKEEEEEEEVREEEQQPEGDLQGKTSSLLSVVSPLNTISKQIKKVAIRDQSAVGHICLEMTFIPFEAQGGQGGDDRAGREGDGAASSAPPAPSSALLKRTITFKSISNADTRGVLSIHIIKATQLGSSTATFVELVCQEQTSSQKRIAMSTPHEFDANPKFDYRADFANISAQSVMTLTVKEVGMDLLRRRTFHRVGFCSIDVLNDVVEVGGHSRDAYSLIGAEAGELHVSCQWLQL